MRKEKPPTMDELRDEMRKKSVPELKAYLGEHRELNETNLAVMKACLDVLDEKDPLSEEMYDDLYDTDELFDDIFWEAEWLIRRTRRKAFFFGLAVGTGCAAALTTTAWLLLGRNRE